MVEVAGYLALWWRELLVVLGYGSSGGCGLRRCRRRRLVGMNDMVIEIG